MRISDALNILGLVGQADLASCKKAFRSAASKYHPDHGGSTEMMQAINEAWESICQWYAENPEQPLRDHNEPSGYGDLLNAAINAIVEIAGLEIEICGAWVWVGGDTKPAKEALKAAGYRWGGAKRRWYFRPAGYKSRGRGKWSMDDIRDFHGSQHVPGRAAPQHARIR